MASGQVHGDALSCWKGKMIPMLMGFLVSVYKPSKRIKANDNVFLPNLTFSIQKKVGSSLNVNEYLTMVAQGLKENQACLSKWSRSDSQEVKVQFRSLVMSTATIPEKVKPMCLGLQGFQYEPWCLGYHSLLSSVDCLVVRNNFN